MLSGVGCLSDFGERIAKLEAEVDNLNGWQKNQNGALLRVDAKVDGLKNWILGLLGTSVLSLILLVVNLVAKN
ncbi:MAG: hypothetical protein A4E53_00364 [Pelotomaculum sp. PtaB.Bin104]|nr:MAG: hypothetical protein A4E53_00364 [Pelotomaculum sp. PtaB.Bin104]